MLFAEGEIGSPGDANMMPEEGQVLIGPQFSEPVRVETVKADGPASWVVGVVGTKTERYRRVALTEDDLAQITIQSATLAFDGDPGLLRLGLQAYALGIAFEFDPYFGLSISRVDPLPHQLEAVYDHLLKLAQVRFLLADDAGAGKTIMAGLLVRELKLRGLIERILVVCPANLAFQWQRELKEKFDEKFEVVKGGDLREQYGINQFLERSQVITSLDLAKRDDVLPGLRQVHWDLVIVDEAHRMSWSPPSRKTARYALGELLRDTADHMLMLTATPHKGDPQNFTLFLQLLDPDVYADVTSIRQAMENRRAPFYLRRTKEAMVYFPERAADGEWVARKVFTKRIPHSVDFKIDGDEFELYAEVTRFIRRQSAAAAARGEEARARAVGFLMALYQRRLASSTYALRRSLENRVNRLTELLKKARDIAREAPAEIPSEDELEEMEEADRERWERVLEAITLANNPEQVREEIAELGRLAGLAQSVEETVSEVKLAKLHSLLESEGFFADPDQRLLIFTEFRDTLDYILSKLAAWGLKAGSIHGSMNIGARDIPGTRLYAEQQFKDGDIQVLVATEAAGEGINLQFCHFLINYDIPWNPNRLEQRMGRIHRYGQRHDCLIFNFVATNTVEGRVLERLLHKLQEIRDALDDDAVFNVVGEVMPAAQIERILRDYYAGRLGEEDMEDRLLRGVDEDRFRAICQNALEGLASRKLNLEMLIERRARAQERRVVPETIARFLAEAGSAATLPLREVAGLPHTFDPGRTPTPLRLFEREPDWRLPPLVARYPRLSTDRDVADERNLEWVTPGHPLFEALRRHALKQAQPNWTAGACFYSVDQDEPSRLDFYRARVVDGLGHTVHERLYAIEIDREGEARLREPSILGDLTLGVMPDEMPAVASLPEATDTLNRLALRPFLEEVRDERVAEVERIAAHVDTSLTELLAKADQEIGRANEDQEQAIAGAEGRLAQAENRHAELLARRERRREELGRQRALTLQGVERLASALVLPHPERSAPEVARLRPNPETERIAMETVINHERSLGRQVFDVSEKNLGYDVTSLDLESGELRLIEVKGLADDTGIIRLTPNEKRVAEDRRECYWLYVVTNCADAAVLQEPRADPAALDWHEVKKVAHYYLSVDAVTRPIGFSERPQQSYGPR
jgi:superfamily II DNA or RNA helicase